ncbi:uncharacterized protein PHACADRAFT_250022 [Phanerochaete carnosa HHB-10118-sp]|uniref:Uncharacterized protein n=1 Tax=Phanerochaete carnosa (strain HHB-10118-sp) TaxID=650164 RepID=K5X9C6_PHACS|nr:uncharacterized protein PHACADRAFT_250022 [Phanerochaete carnosa HHB-10118-sp]EKM59492.1 hypothetical protein PHACADRAFT_250022 [Phanerochaete carnosa HHB-10118-sp]
MGGDDRSRVSKRVGIPARSTLLSHSATEDGSHSIHQAPVPPGTDKHLLPSIDLQTSVCAEC